MNCQTPGCGKAIEPVPDGFRSPSGYLHTASNRVCCFDVYKPDFATPASQPERTN